ncbi:MAG: ATP-binding protein [Oscillospiraceae bacterium]|nr:ATP-binding protein [Oscillospiraceae bacterium]
MNFEITSGKVTGKGLKVVLYGAEGVGKSSLAARFPNPVFIDTEGSTDGMDVRRLPKPTSWQMMNDEVRFIMNGGAPCGTLVIDTFDWAEQLCIDNLCTQHSKKGIEDFGYGNGYVYEREEIGRFLTLLEEVTLRGINVVISCHAATRKYELPEEMGQYDRWELKLGKKTGSQISPLVKEWADMVLFLNYKTHVFATDDKGKKHKAAGRERVMYTSHHPCWDAKNRCGLPDELPLAYESIAAVIPDHFGTVIPQQTAPVQRMLEKAQAMGIPTTPADALEEYQPIGTDEGIAYTPPEGLPKALTDLMCAQLVTPEEVEAVVAAKGYMPKGMPLRDYPADFVQQVLIGAWSQVYDCIAANRLR